MWGVSCHRITYFRENESIDNVHKRNTCKYGKYVYFIVKYVLLAWYICIVSIERRVVLYKHNI